MTFREKLQQEHPEYVRRGFKGGCAYCPCDWGYEPSSKKAHNPCATDTASLDEKCKKCWDREMPEVRKES